MIPDSPRGTMRDELSRMRNPAWEQKLPLRDMLLILFHEYPSALFWTADELVDGVSAVFFRRVSKGSVVRLLTSLTRGEHIVRLAPGHYCLPRVAEELRKPA